MATLQEKLEKIKSPKLQNQHHTAVVLSAVEDTLRDQNADFTPTAYFAALLALLPQSITNQGIVNKDLAASVIYLLDLVSADVPTPLLRSKFSQILTSLAPALSLPEIEAPLLRSSIGCLQSLLVAQDSAAWALPQSQIGPRRAIAGLLALAVDHRPKVRKRAQDALDYVFKRPPPSPSLDHPAADMCAETALKTLSDSVSAAGKIKKSRAGQQSAAQHEPALMHSLQLVKTIASASTGWPSKKIEPLCELLMNVSRSSNEYLTMGAFEIFEIIFEGMADDISSSKLPRLLQAISELKPAHNDSQLLPPWIAVLSRGYDVSAQVSPQETFEKLPELFELMASFLTSPSHNIRVSASECLISFVVNCIPGSVILEPSIYDEKTLENLAKAATGLLSVKYQTAWAEVFKVMAAMFDAFKWRASPRLSEIVQTIGELRGNENFHGKKEADSVLGAAIAAMGPEAVLEILPLNLAQKNSDQHGRVWLLPILRDHVSNTRLGYFRSEFVPLSEALYQRVLEYGSEEKTVEVKIFETLVQQAWGVLPGFCELPLDLTEAFDQSFAELLSKVLYKQTELRVDVCKALQNLVDSNKAITTLQSDGDDLILQRRISKDTAQKNLAHLASFASNLLAVLFNVYSQTLPQFRGFILQCINAYLGITPEKELMETFTRVTTMLESALPEKPEKKQQAQGSADKMPPTSHTLMDLVVTISIYLPRSSFGTLFSLAAVVLNKESADPQLIKKAYKLIPRLATSESGSAALRERSSELQELLISTADKALPPARRDRFLAIHEVISFLPTSDLHFIPSILSEVVLGCKESNEKARTAAFTLLVHLANRISDPERNPAGTVIRNSLAPHMPDDAPNGPANIEEFFTMVSAGLAGTSPHMVAASVTALSRLFFEYHTKLPASILGDLVQTIDLFLTSNNREIVRSVLGFVKVAVVALPEDLLRPRLASIVPNLMVWSKEHKGRLKTKVKGILDRLIRRFGSSAVEELVGDADRKLVVAIRKERERKKKNKKGGKEGGEEDEEEEGADQRRKPGEKSFSNAFDKAVYGSDPELSDSDSDDASELEVDAAGETHRLGTAASKGKKSKGKRGATDDNEQYIRELSPESNPLDLLAPDALASISSTKPSVRFLSDSKTKKSSARVDEDGKLLLGTKASAARRDQDGDTTMDVSTENDGNDGVGAYLAAVSGPDAVRKGQKGRLKVSQSGVGKRAAAAAAAADEMEIDSGDEQAAAKPAAASRGGINSGRRGLGMPKTTAASGGRIEKRRKDFKAGRGGHRRSGSGFRARGRK